MGAFVAAIKWFFSIGDHKKTYADAASNLHHSMLITARCRFNASKRIGFYSNRSFHTTLLLSLGMFLIPLLQVCGIELQTPGPVLSVVQLFLTVAVLLYSTIMGTARYEVRADKLNDAGNRIKELGRQLQIALESAKAGGSPVDVSDFQRRYEDASRDSENHSNTDYALAKLESPLDYHITGFLRLWVLASAKIRNFLPYSIPLALLTLEGICISDALGLTHLLTTVLTVKAHVP